MASSYFNLFALRREFDIVHVHEAHWIASLGAIFALRNGKTAIIKEASSGEYLRLNFDTQLFPASTRSAAIFIAISTRIAAELGRIGIPASRIRVIPNGVTVPETSWKEVDSDGSVLFVGNLSQQPYKGIDVLIRAWARVAQRAAGSRLVLLGGGDDASLKALCLDLGIADSVEFKGAVRNVPDFMSKASVYVLPSRIEGMSNSLLEAMALGLPVVATRISGSEDLIRSGENGILVASEDAEGMADAIVRLLEDRPLAAALGRKARETIAEGYTVDAIAERYAELYHSTLHSLDGGGKSGHAR